MSPEKLYQENLATKTNIGERNDCGVVSLSMAANIKYEDARNALANEGRKPKGFSSIQMLLSALEKKGYSFSWKHNLQPNGSKYTPITIGKACSKGAYLAFTKNHVFAVIDGKVYDWAAKRRLRINYILKVNRPVK